LQIKTKVLNLRLALKKKLKGSAFLSESKQKNEFLGSIISYQREFDIREKKGEKDVAHFRIICIFKVLTVKGITINFQQMNNDKVTKIIYA